METKKYIKKQVTSITSQENQNTSKMYMYISFLIEL